MKKSFDESLIAFSESEANLNLSRYNFFSDCNKNLFLSKYYQPYEESLERYFFNLHRLFADGLHDKNIKEGINSKDPDLRTSVLQIIKDGFFSDSFMQEIARDLLILDIKGNDNDRTLVGQILSRKYSEKSLLIELLPDCISQCFSELDTYAEDVFYVYQNSWYIMLILNAENLLKEHIRFGENHENPEVRELAAEYKIDMEQALRP
ncbi:hypothetical protein [Massilia sp. CCM 8734]|uniref:hypothetical protein n=1 Tax=Massilia sp. CCM 8734 TaxID=2609283 RepID=UPI0014206F42|nr:hypothetical protein [Massilia sp. CCM 8734]NHZ99186.1 hypothetical protein [Massilia sp. CCM 8734]